MNTIVVTGGEEFTDIDVLACSFAYSELLNIEGKRSYPALPGALNNSCTPTVRSWIGEYKKAPDVIDAKYVIVDLSDPAYIAKFVDTDRIIEIYDHRSGFEGMWKTKLDADCHIEPVGACATLIWEEYVKRGHANKISTASARLLSAAIVSNTLNFFAHVTSERDKKAFSELKKHCNLAETWTSEYFDELQAESLMGDITTTIRNDTKVIDIHSLGYRIVIAQLELWNGKRFIELHQDEITKILQSYNVEDWLMSIPSISEGKNYLFTMSERVKRILHTQLGAEFEGLMGTTDRLWLRKEIKALLAEVN